MKRAISKRTRIKKTILKSPEDEASFRSAVAHKAYELYKQRGGQPGNDQADWYEAERIVSAGSQ